MPSIYSVPLVRLALAPAARYIARMLNVIPQTIVSALRSHRALALENLALRHQLEVLQRGARRPRLTSRDRALWIILSRREGAADRAGCIVAAGVRGLHPWGSRAQTGFIGELGGPATGPLGEAPFQKGLELPSDPPDQEALIAGPRCLSEGLSVLLPELSDGSALESRSFFGNIQEDHMPPFPSL